MLRDISFGALGAFVSLTVLLALQGGTGRVSSGCDLSCQQGVVTATFYGFNELDCDSDVFPDDNPKCADELANVNAVPQLNFVHQIRGGEVVSLTFSFAGSGRATDLITVSRTGLVLRAITGATP